MSGHLRAARRCDSSRMVGRQFPQRVCGLVPSLASTLALTLASALATALSGCAGPDARGAAAPMPTGPGYAGHEHLTVTTRATEWLIDGHDVKVLLSEPASAQTLPVVLYVPGLGESNGAGERWRDAWAAAGYAVVSVQPLADDEMAWRSELARDGEFKALGRERYGAEATQRRVRSIALIAAEARRRSRAGEDGWNRIDWDRAAIAGFELGAYTALASTDGVFAASEAMPDAVKFRAVVALSPYASVPPRAAASDVAAANAAIPTLAITSEIDGDPLGVVEPSAAKGEFFNRWHGPDRYLLLMADLTHAGLSGNPVNEKAAGNDVHMAPSESDKDDGSGGGAGRSGRGRRGGTSLGTSRKTSTPSGGEAAPDILTPAETRARTAQAAEVTTAFLDAYVKNEAKARDWLHHAAAPWLGASGELRRAASTASAAATQPPPPPPRN